MNIEAIPLEILTKVFSYLKKRDRLSCSLVCVKWQKAMHSPTLWKDVTVLLDSDFSEISTLLALRQYNAFFKTMKFRWTNPYLPTRWMLQPPQDVSKRICRYLMTMCVHNVQLQSVSLIDWTNSQKFKKVVYHMCRFLKSQLALRKISFSNINFNDTASVKFVLNCMNSSSSITHLDVSSCKPPLESSARTFASCVQQLSNLSVLKIEYCALSTGVFEALLESGHRNLETLDVFFINFHETVRHISGKQWADFNALCPKLKVSFYFKNVTHFDKVNQYLNRGIPLTTFSVTCGTVADQSRTRKPYRTTLLLLINHYHKTIENVYLQTNYYNLEVLDDVIVVLLQKCANLQQLDFNGIVEHLELVREICELQLSGRMERFNCFHVFPKSISCKQHILLSEIYRDYGRQLRKLSVDFQIRTSCHKNEVLAYY